MLNVSVSPSASLAVGLKLYCWPTCTVLAGVPEIVGGLLAGGGGSLGGGSLGGGSLGGGSLGGGSLGGGSLGGGSLGGSLGATTRIVKGGSVVVAWPSLTEMTMLRYLPVCASDGTPSRVP